MSINISCAIDWPFSLAAIASRLREHLKFIIPRRSRVYFLSSLQHLQLYNGQRWILGIFRLDSLAIIEFIIFCKNEKIFLVLENYNLIKMKNNLPW